MGMGSVAGTAEGARPCQPGSGISLCSAPATTPTPALGHSGPLAACTPRPCEAPLLWARLTFSEPDPTGGCPLHHHVDTS